MAGSFSYSIVFFSILLQYRKYYATVSKYDNILGVRILLILSGFDTDLDGNFKSYIDTLEDRCYWYIEHAHQSLAITSPSFATPHHLVLLPTPLNIIPPTTPAAIATPLRIATPIKPSLATLLSINSLKLLACKFAGSLSSNKSLYLRASA